MEACQDRGEHPRACHTVPRPLLKTCRWCDKRGTHDLRCGSGKIHVLFVQMHSMACKGRTWSLERLIPRADFLFARRKDTLWHVARLAWRGCWKRGELGLTDRECKLAVSFSSVLQSLVAQTGRGLYSERSQYQTYRQHDGMMPTCK